jgi:hypothetical protein
MLTQRVSEGVLIGVGTRTQFGKRIKNEIATETGEHGWVTETVRGVLRAVHLDKHWLLVTGGQEPVRVHGVQDTLDDVISPMVNRAVVVTARKPKKQYRLIDIEVEE